MRAGGSATVPGLSGAKVIGLKFYVISDTVHQVVLNGANTTFNCIQPDGLANNYDIYTMYGQINVSDNVVKCSKCGWFLARSTGLGNSFTLQGGDNGSITEIWRIV